MHPSHSFFDFAILGAGASGLLLACEIATKGLVEGKSLCIIEKEKEKGNDRTWCFWNDAELPEWIQKSISYSWQNVESEGATQNLSPYDYQHIRSDDFYQKTKNHLLKYPNVHFLNEEVLKVVKSNDKYAIIAKSSHIQSNWVFTSMPVNKSKTFKSIALWQSFYGWRVQFQSQREIQLNLKLMDFEVEQQGATQFIYVLPLGNNKALIELTRFGTEPIQETKAEPLLRNYISRICPNYIIEEVEINKIPMSQVFDSQKKFYDKDQRIIEIGTLAGALKPSTGYGFLRMHMHAREIADALWNDAPMPKIFRPKRFRFYDALLLNILEHYPQEGRKIFKSLFSKVSTPLILKFLNEKTTLQEEIKIFSVLPKAIFIKSLVQHLAKPKHHVH